MNCDDAFAGSDPFPSTEWDRLGDVGWFCERYRGAVREYLRRRVGPQDASDVCQAFFEKKVMREGLLGKADPGRGSLRGLLVTAINNLVLQQVRASWAQKRGGGMRREGLVDEVQPMGAVPLHGASPERLHDLRWAQDLLEQAIRDTEDWCRKKGRAQEFTALRPMLDGSGPARPYREVAAELGMTPRDVATVLKRLRERVGRYVAERIERLCGGASGMSAEVIAEFRRILEDRT
jgi:DNA-directed RNA polymerase specialized sigma24 family protein